MRRRRAVYTADAAADLGWIYETIADAGSPDIASRYERRIREFCDRLAYGAERGTLRDDVRPNLRVIGFERRVTIAIAVEDERVIVLRIFYGGRDWEADFA